MKAKLNVDTDKVVTKYISLPINKHILSLQFIIYINHQYPYHNINKNIRNHVHVNNGIAFLKKKYTWSELICV